LDAGGFFVYMEQQKKTDSEIRQAAVDQLMDKPLDIEVVFEDYPFWRKLGVLRKKKVYRLNSLKLGSFLLISRILEKISLTKEELERTNLELAIKYATLHMEDYADIVAIALHNKPGKPPKSIKAALMGHVTAQQMFEIVQAVVIAMDVTPFTSTIILTSGMSLMKAPELIADQALGE